MHWTLRGPVTGSGTLHWTLHGPVTGHGRLHWTLRGPVTVTVTWHWTLHGPLQEQRRFKSLRLAGVERGQARKRGPGHATAAMLQRPGACHSGPGHSGPGRRFLALAVRSGPSRLRAFGGPLPAAAMPVAAAAAARGVPQRPMQVTAAQGMLQRPGACYSGPGHATAALTAVQGMLQWSGAAQAMPKRPRAFCSGPGHATAPQGHATAAWATGSGTLHWTLPELPGPVTASGTLH